MKAKAIQAVLFLAAVALWLPAALATKHHLMGTARS
jgi:hypothetical protein